MLYSLIRVVIMYVHADQAALVFAEHSLLFTSWCLGLVANVLPRALRGY